MRTRLAVVIGLTLLITILVCSWLVRGEAKFFINTNRLGDATGFASASLKQNLEFAFVAFESPGESDTTPVDAVDDSYTVHISGRISDVARNDLGPNGPGFDSYRVVTLPTHGTLNPVNNSAPLYTHEKGFTGIDSFIYDICEGGDCDTATVTITVVNLPPVAVDDRYEVTAPYGRIGPFANNDDDTDDSAFETFRIVNLPSHGRLEPETSSAPLYYPDEGYTGPDSLIYEVCDVFNACSTATVYINDDYKNCGSVGCNQRIGKPINVTNGNTYLQQTDFQLPGVGQAIEITRTYNSSSLRVGLFGLAWSSAYDEALTQFSNTNLRLFQPDGRAVDFILVAGTSNTYQPVQGDFRGQILRTGSGYTLTLKNGEVHTFGAYGKLLTVNDRNNNQTSLDYDANGNLAGITDPFGRVLSVTSNAAGRVVSIADALGTIATYRYDPQDELASVTYGDDSRFDFAYDANNLLTNVTDALGNILEAHTYDSNRRGLTSEGHGGVERYVLNYVSDTETEVTDALGRVTKFTLDKSKGRNVVTRVEGFCSCGDS
jgi:YD repeat-containing protein